MNVFYEEDGAFKAGAVLADQQGAFQVESLSGKRSKIKRANVLIEFKEVAPATFLREAQLRSEEIDLDFLWECAPAEEFGFAELAADYFGHAPTALESASLVLRLHGAPMYFYRKGRGRYKSAPADALKAALAGIERKKQLALLQAHYVEELKAHRMPAPMLPHVGELLFRPDKNGVEYKALEQAAHERNTTPARLVLACGALASPRELHLARFFALQFPAATGFDELKVSAAQITLPTAVTRAFSIDDHTTTEIDDALSVVAIEGGWRIGVHISAPGIAIRRGDALDHAARERFSTVYMPGDKFTMLPAAAVEAYTLVAGKECAAVSIYFDVRESDWSITAQESRVEMVLITHNLRHNELDAVITEETLEGDGEFPCKEELGVLWRFSQALFTQRQAARVAAGLKPETNHRLDYNFYIETQGGAERVVISQRRRDAPLDKLVAELMILTNSSWGKLLEMHDVAGVYRTQQGFGAAGRVRMVTHPAPHQGLGVAQYAWSTSPLRRYVDLVNQWQILSCLTDLPLAYERNDADLFAVVTGFEAAYAAYAEFQATMERYWCLRWLAQENVRITEAQVLRDDWVRLPEIPLQIRVPGLPPLARGTRVELEVTGTDEVDLSVECRLLAIIEEVDDTGMPDGEDADGQVVAQTAES